MKIKTNDNCRWRKLGLAPVLLVLCLALGGSPGYAVPDPLGGLPGGLPPAASPPAISAPLSPEAVRAPGAAGLPPISLPAGEVGSIRLVPLPSLPPTDLTPFRSATTVPGKTQQVPVQLVTHPRITYQTVHFFNGGPVISEEDRKKLEALLAEIREEIERLKEQRERPPAGVSADPGECGGGEGLTCDAGDIVGCNDPVCREQKPADKAAGQGGSSCQPQPGACGPGGADCGPGQQHPQSNR